MSAATLIHGYSIYGNEASNKEDCLAFKVVNTFYQKVEPRRLLPNQIPIGTVIVIKSLNGRL